MIFANKEWRENSNIAIQNSAIIKIGTKIVMIFTFEIIVPFSFSQSKATIIYLAQSLAKPTNQCLSNRQRI